jgi:hypothetical protein
MHDAHQYYFLSEWLFYRHLRSLLKDCIFLFPAPILSLVLDLKAFPKQTGSILHHENINPIDIDLADKVIIIAFVTNSRRAKRTIKTNSQLLKNDPQS